MSIHRYSLQKYKSPASRFTCPSCGHKKEFTRYIDNGTGLHLADYVGLCNRSFNCGYHYPPKEYFKEHPERKPELPYKKAPEGSKQTPVYIPFSEMVSTRSGWNRNTFYIFLRDTFGKQAAEKVLANYPIGTMRHTNWRSCTVFWYVDKQGDVRAGQVKAFDTKGHTKKNVTDYEVKSITSWYHSILKKHADLNNELLPDWLPAYLEQHGKASCMFGEHLLAVRPNDPVAIVEAPKTAIIASMFYPEFVWVAVGAKSYLNAQRCAALKNRDVALFPDLDGYKEWTKRAESLYSLVKSIYVDATLLDLAKSGIVSDKEDLADYLVRCDLTTFVS
jgi:hypothetical protein